MYAVGGGWLCDSALFASARECYLPKLARACTAARLKRLEFVPSVLHTASVARLSLDVDEPCAEHHRSEVAFRTTACRLQ